MLNPMRFQCSNDGRTDRRFVPALLLIVSLTAGSTACVTGLERTRRAAGVAALSGTWWDSTSVQSSRQGWYLRSDGALWTLSAGPAKAGALRAETEPRRRRAGYWSVRGDLTSPSHQAVCFRTRAREFGTCILFELDTLAESPAGAGWTRRLLLAGYPGERGAKTRILHERQP